MASLKATSNLFRPQVNVWTRAIQKQPFLAHSIVLSQVPKASILGIRAYSSKNNQMQIPLRDLGVFGKIITAIKGRKESKLTEVLS